MDKEQYSNTNNNSKVHSNTLAKSTESLNDNLSLSNNSKNKMNSSSSSNNEKFLENNTKKNCDKLSKNINSQMTISEEIAFLRIKNLKLKQKNSLYKENYYKVLEEKANINNCIEKLNLKNVSEKKIRKQTEQQLLEIFTKETDNKKIKESLISDNEKKKVLIKSFELENDKNKLLIKSMETEIAELKNNIDDFNNNNLIRRASFTFSSEAIEIRRDSFSINSQNIKNLNENIQQNYNFNLNAINNNIQMSSGIINNKNINLINGINLNNRIEENFFKNAGNNLRDSSNSTNNNQNINQINFTNFDNFRATSFNSTNNENKAGPNIVLERKISIGKAILFLFCIKNLKS